jgi:hypothetical protein
MSHYDCARPALRLASSIRRDAKSNAASQVRRRREARNAISHLAIGLQDDEALRYLDAMHQLLKLVKAPAGEVAESKKLYDAHHQRIGV